MVDKKYPPVWSDEWILQQAKELDLKVGYVEIGRPQDNPTLIDDYIHLIKKENGVEK